MTRTTSSERAFSLLEVMLAVAMIAALAGGLSTFLYGVLQRREAINRFAAASSRADDIVSRLESDLATCVAFDAATGSGVRGGARSILIVSRGVGPKSDREQSLLAPMQVTEMEFDAAAGTLRARRRAPDDAGAPWDTIPRVIAALRFRYHDGTQWRDSFDSAQEGMLPVAIEVCIWTGEPSSAGPAASSPGSGAPAARGATGGSGEEGVDGGGVGQAEPESASEVGPTATLPARPPDRTRVLVIPDAPMTAWKEGV